jgi:DNA-binding response OmpR family regulator
MAPRLGPRTRALIVDSHVTTRSILVSHLRTLGVEQVALCMRTQEALRKIQDGDFDLLLCEHRLADGTLGKDLIEELRRTRLLSLRTVVILISADASYDTVAEAAESAVDGFLIRPYTPGSLEDRLTAAFRRKEALSPVFDAIAAGQHAQGLQLCEKLYSRRATHWTCAARLGAELALRLDRASLASELFASVLAVKAVPWAKLGIARTLVASSQAQAAASTIETLLAAEPRYVDAYDVMGRLHAEQGNLPAALKAYEQASRITPASVQRAQRYGIVAYYAGEPEVARAALERAARLGGGSRHVDAQTLLLLALLHHRERQADGIVACRLQVEEQLRSGAGSGVPAQPAPERVRLQRVASIILALDATLRQATSEAAERTAALAAQAMQPDFDIEAATNLLSLLAALHGSAVDGSQAAFRVRQLGLRFCISRQATDVLVQAAQAHAPYAELLRQAHAEIGERAQAALGQVLTGQPQAAVQQLLAEAVTTRNVKLLKDAKATLERYREHIADAHVLQRRCETLQALWDGTRKQEDAAPGEPPVDVA